MSRLAARILLWRRGALGNKNSGGTPTPPPQTNNRYAATFALYTGNF